MLKDDIEMLDAETFPVHFQASTKDAEQRAVTASPSTLSSSKSTSNAQSFKTPEQEQEAGVGEEL